MNPMSNDRTLDALDELVHGPQMRPKVLVFHPETWGSIREEYREKRPDAFRHDDAYCGIPVVEDGDWPEALVGVFCDMDDAEGYMARRFCGVPPVQAVNNVFDLGLSELTMGDSAYAEPTASHPVSETPIFAVVPVLQKRNEKEGETTVFMEGSVRYVAILMDAVAGAICELDEKASEDWTSVDMVQRMVLVNFREKLKDILESELSPAEKEEILDDFYSDPLS